MAAGVPSAIGAKRAVNPGSKHLLRITSEEAQYEGARGTRLELGSAIERNVIVSFQVAA
jgi:hypothetical protein